MPPIVEELSTSPSYLSSVMSTSMRDQLTLANQTPRSGSLPHLHPAFRAYCVPAQQLPMRLAEAEEVVGPLEPWLGLHLSIRKLGQWEPLGLVWRSLIQRPKRRRCLYSRSIQ